MFSSRSVWVHLLRGGIGFGCLALAIFQLTHSSLWGLPLLVAGFVLLRGCPACWTIGLIATIRNRRVTCQPCAEKSRLAFLSARNDTAE